MQLRLQPSKLFSGSELTITGSKSESNRILLLQALYPNIKIENLSNSDDSQLMQKALSTDSTLVDIHHAGTAMRFLTAFYATQNGKTTILTGSKRMKERPIQILVDALKTLGAQINYTETIGFPPLEIFGQELYNDHVTLEANVSSQYISALLLIAPKLKNGLTLHLKGKITSVPYIKMTLALLEQLHIKTNFEGQTVRVEPCDNSISKTIVVESDWSSASYYYSLIALSAVGTKISIKSYRSNSLQGDSVLQNIYKKLGVESHFEATTLVLKKVNHPLPECLELDLSDAPDIAQTIAVTCLGLQISCHLTGLHTLKIKETDRLKALKNEIEKFGSTVEISESHLRLQSPKPLLTGIAVDTYNDHRMAMAFAPLVLLTEFYINDAEVVSKSYPDFWMDLKHIGCKITES